VISGLGKALQKKGHLVEIILPKYDCMQNDQVNNLKVYSLFLTEVFGRFFCLFKILFFYHAGFRCCCTILL
jgi:glycogen synthase